MTNKPPFNGERVRLGNVCKIDNGYAFNSKLFNNNHQGMPLIRIRDIKIGSTSTYTTENYSKEYVVKNGDLLIGMDGEFNITEWSSGDALLNQRVCKISSTSERLSNRFLRFLLPPILKEIEDRTPLVTVKHLSTKTLQKTEVILPEIDKQNRIADIFGTVVSIIVYKKHQLDLLDQLVKSRFVEMFGDIYTSTKWEKVYWSEVVSIQNGKDYKQHLVESGGYPVCGSGGEIARADDYLCPENTVIIGRKGTINNPILMKEKFWNVDTAFGVIPSERINIEYLYAFCKQFDFSQLNKQATLPSTTKKDLLNITIMLPPLSLQNEFADFVAQVDKSQFVVQQQIEKLQTLYDSLAQEYFG